MVYLQRKSMSTKFIKYSIFFSSLLSLQSCDILFSQEDDHIKTYLCNPSVEILQFNELNSDCKYSIQYKNTHTSLEGYFVLTFRNDKRSYNLNSGEMKIQHGQNNIVLTISNCTIDDQLIDVCFATYQ